MATGQEKKVKVSDLPESGSFSGLYTLGYKWISGVRTSVKVSLQMIQEAYEDVLQATGLANAATTNADAATASAKQAAQDAVTATTATRQATVDALAAKEAADTATGNTIEAIRNAEAATASTRKAIKDAGAATALAYQAAQDADTSREAIEANEAIRQSQENARQTNTATAISNAEKATAAANKAKTDADTATGLANQAAQNADTSRETIEANETTRQTQENARQTNTATAISNAEKATAAANKAKTDADTATALANQAAQNADTSRTQIEANETTRQQQETKRQADTATAIRNAETATANAITAKENADAATALATELNDHPMKIQGGVWYKWDADTDAYVNTGIQAKGDPGASFRIIGQYATEAALKAAVPDGTDVDGVYAVGTSDPFSYYAWVFTAGAWQWQNQGQLRGPEGKSAYEVWISDPDHADDTVDDWLAWLQKPATDAAADARQAITDAGTATAAANTAANKALAAESAAMQAQQYAFEKANYANSMAMFANSEGGRASSATSNANTAAANANSAAASILVPDIDHEPGETDLAYVKDGKTYSYRIGGLCRYYNAQLGDHQFFQLYDITTDGKAVWKEAGSGGSFKGTELSLTANLPGDTAAHALEVETDGRIERYEFLPGTPVRIRVEAGKTAHIRFPEVPGYIKPEDASYTSDGSVKETAMSVEYEPGLIVTFESGYLSPANIAVPGEYGMSQVREITDEARKRYLVKKETDGRMTARQLSADNTAMFTDGTAAPISGEGEGDVMVRLPKLWYNVYRKDNRVFVHISRVQKDALPYCFPGGWLGAYKASLDNGTLCSRSGKTPLTGQTYARLKELAAARGEGYELVGYDQHCEVALLLYALYRTRDIQGVLGEGGACYNAYNTTGYSDPTGNADTSKESFGYVSGLGLEGVFGCIYEYMDRAYKQGGEWHFTEPDGTERTVPSEGGTGWVSEMMFERSSRFDLIPTEVGASGTSGYTDFFESAESPLLPFHPARSCFTVAGGGFQDDGIAYLNLLNTANDSSPFYGTRLAYRGDDVEIVGN